MITEAQRKYDDSLKYFYTLLESINRAIYLNPYEDSLYRLKPKIGNYKKALENMKIALSINPISEESYVQYSALLI